MSETKYEKSMKVLAGILSGVTPLNNENIESYLNRVDRQYKNVSKDKEVYRDS